MVMVTKPSPIQVGREFVKQYYTLLNKGPEMLYRFYSAKSSYIHGGTYSNGEVEAPAIGQMAIHQKISSLKFCDCHTKIRQVDADTTIGDGVVVQVIGELSNCRQPMRRFMQTFVLAPQGDNPFKFYVNNNIFRYQDEVFNDDLSVEHSEDDEQEYEVESPETQAQPAVNQTNAACQENYYNQSAVNQASENQSPALTNGIEPRLETTTLDQPSSTSPAMETSQQTASSSRTTTPDIEPEPVEPSSPVSKDLPEDPPKDSESLPKDQEAPVETKSPPAKALSWADLISKNTPAARNATPQASVVKTNRQPPPEPQPETIEQTEPPARSTRAPRNNRHNHHRNYQRDDERSFGDRPEGQRRMGGQRGGSPGTGRESNGTIRYPDNQQIFVGNLPYDIDDTELKDHFADFGNVIEVKINHSHSNNPSFGFVIFADPKSVDHVLEILPTQYKNSHRINIEEKKQRSRDNGRRGGDPRRNGIGDNRGGRRGPPMMRRDRQGSREGPPQNYNNGPRR